MKWFKAILITVGPRILGAIAGGLASWVYAKTNGAVEIDATKAAEIFTAGLIGYSAAHKGISSFVNPGDAAKLRVATAEKDAVEVGGTVTVARHD